MEPTELPDPPPRPMTFQVWGREETIADGEVVRPTGLVRLRGIDVREAALAVLIHRHPWPVSIGDILIAFDDRGCEVRGHAPRKTLADALAYEVKRGRAVRAGRGIYQLGAISRTTGWRIRRRWGLRCWADAQWYPRRVWRPTRYGRPVVPSATLRLLSRREPGLAERLTGWTPAVMDAPLDPSEAAEADRW